MRSVFVIDLRELGLSRSQTNSKLFESGPNFKSKNISMSTNNLRIPIKYFECKTTSIDPNIE